MANKASIALAAAIEQLLSTLKPSDAVEVEPEPEENKTIEEEGDEDDEEGDRMKALELAIDRHAKKLENVQKRIDIIYSA